MRGISVVAAPEISRHHPRPAAGTVAQKRSPWPFHLGAPANLEYLSARERSAVETLRYCYRLPYGMHVPALLPHARRCPQILQRRRVLPAVKYSLSAWGPVVGTHQQPLPALTHLQANHDQSPDGSCMYRSRTCILVIKALFGVPGLALRTASVGGSSGGALRESCSVKKEAGLGESGGVPVSHSNKMFQPPSLSIGRRRIR